MITSNAVRNTLIIRFLGDEPDFRFNNIRVDADHLEVGEFARALNSVQRQTGSRFFLETRNLLKEDV